MQSGVMDPGHQPYEGPWLIAERTSHRPGVGQCTFLVITVISCIISRSSKVRTCGIPWYAVVTVAKAKYQHEVSNTICGCIRKLRMWQRHNIVYTTEYMLKIVNTCCCCCCCCLHIKLFFLPNDISSTPSILPDSSS